MPVLRKLRHARRRSTMEQDKGDRGAEQKGKVSFKEWWR